MIATVIARRDKDAEELALRLVGLGFAPVRIAVYDCHYYETRHRGIELYPLTDRVAIDSRKYDVMIGEERIFPFYRDGITIYPSWVLNTSERIDQVLETVSVRDGYCMLMLLFGSREEERTSLVVIDAVMLTTVWDDLLSYFSIKYVVRESERPDEMVSRIEIAFNRPEE